MSLLRRRISINPIVEVTPIIIKARAILAVSDTSSRKSEFRVVDNQATIANPEIQPRVFLECEVVEKNWSYSGPRTIVIDIENYKTYKNVTGRCKNQYSQYLLNVKNPHLCVNDITNLDSIIKMALNGE
jgi:hypothetical protein